MWDKRLEAGVTFDEPRRYFTTGPIPRAGLRWPIEGRAPAGFRNPVSTQIGFLTDD
jgi:hypothetical protein